MGAKKLILTVIMIFTMSEIGNIQPINVEAMRQVQIQDNALTASQVTIVRHLETALDTFKVFNQNARIAIIALVGKETNYNPKPETTYANTPNDRIRAIFGSRLKDYNDAQLTVLKKDDVDFFDAVYGGMYGNLSNEGYKYRGRGFNQLTFKANYDTIGQMIGLDLVKNPDLLNDSTIAAKACVAYFVRRFNQAPAGVPKLSDFDTMQTATLYIFRANAGWGKDISGDFHQKTLQSVRNWAQIFRYV